MSGPNPELMHQYGTDAYYLEKTGNLPAALSVAAPLAFLGLAGHEHRRTQRLQQEAELMNQLFRHAEHRRMAQTTAGFGGSRGGPAGGLGPAYDMQFPNDPVMQGFEQAMMHDEFGKMGGIQPAYVKVAEDLGRQLAHQASDELETIMTKMASGEELTELEKEALVGTLMKGLGKGLGAVGKKVGWGGSGSFGKGGLAQKAGTKVRQWGAGLRTKGLQRAGIKAMPEAAAGAASKSKPLIGWGTKAKIGLGVAGLGAGYAGYKGLQAAKDYMMQPTAASSWGAHGVTPMKNVNQLGYAAY